MSYLIDGSNLGGVLGGRMGSRDAEKVVHWLLPWARLRRKVTVVYFDGPPQPDVAPRYGPLEVVFSGSFSADEMIERRVAKHPRGTTVITNDIALADICRDLGAEVLPTSELSSRQRKARRRSEAQEEKPNPSPADVAHWSRIFGRED